MGRRTAPGWRAPTWRTPHYSRTSTRPTLGPSDGRPGSPVGRGVLLWVLLVATPTSLPACSPKQAGSSINSSGSHPTAPATHQLCLQEPAETSVHCRNVLSSSAVITESFTENFYCALNFKSPIHFFPLSAFSNPRVSSPVLPGLSSSRASRVLPGFRFPRSRDPRDSSASAVSSPQTPPSAASRCPVVPARPPGLPPACLPHYAPPVGSRPHRSLGLTSFYFIFPPLLD